MAGNARQVVNMANSIVGVSILSMPFCFKETGLLLGIVLVLVSGFITKKTCMFLIRSAIMARRRSYEFLAFHVFGVSGKLFVEMCMILFLIGICISFHVVMGDLAPVIVARFMNVENSPSLRCTLMIGIALLVILPLCLLRNLDNLASMSACSIMFYFFLVTVVFWHAFPKLWDGSWIHLVDLWRPSGALQVLPILSLALACQSNVFEIYDSVPDPDVPKMRFVVNHAVNLCSALYIAVGFLGYVAFVEKDFSGNIIMSFPNSELTEGIKVFFTVSLAISFPLMIFPCRTSIHSLLYRRAVAEVQTVVTEENCEERSYHIMKEDMSNPSSFDLVGNYMPESRFKAITLGILILSLCIGLLIPNIEYVLGLLGSTMGMLIALILPCVLFIKVNTKASVERLLAQAIMLLGLMLIVTGTYLNVAHIYETQNEVRAVPTDIPADKVELHLPKIDDKIVGDAAKKEGVAADIAVDAATRKEPVAPEPPPEEKEIAVKEKVKNGSRDSSKIDDRIIEKDKEKNKADIDAEIDKNVKKKESIPEKEETKKVKNGETLHPDAIQKEEKVNEEETDKNKEGEVEKKQAEILEKMEIQQEKQEKLLEEQKQILKELKDQKIMQEEAAAKKQDGDKTAQIIDQQAEVSKVEGDSNPAALPAVPSISLGLNDANAQNPRDNLVLLNQENIPAVHVVPAESQAAKLGLNIADQQAPPKESLAEQVVAASNVGIQPVAAVNPAVVPGEPAKVINFPGEPANSPGQPVNVMNSPGQPVNVMNSQGQPAVGVANYVPQLQLAALNNNFGQLSANQHGVVNNAVQPGVGAAPNFIGQPSLDAANSVVGISNHVAQPGVRASNFAAQPAVPAANYAYNYVGQTGYVAQAAANAVNNVGQPVDTAIIAGQPVAAAAYNVGQPPAGPPNNIAQPVAVVANNVGQLHVGAANYAGASGINNPPAAGAASYSGYPGAGAYVGPAVAAGYVEPAVAGDQSAVGAGNYVNPGANPGNQPIISKNIPKVGGAEFSLNRNKPSLKFEDDTKQKIKDSVSQHVIGKVDKLDYDIKGKTDKEAVKKKSEMKKTEVKSTSEKKMNVNKLGKKIARHDEERRKRQVDEESLIEFPQADILKEIKLKDFGDLAYDTRHLLWTGRSRRKKRNKGRDEDYYWDET